MHCTYQEQRIYSMRRKQAPGAALLPESRCEEGTANAHERIVLCFSS